MYDRFFIKMFMAGVVIAALWGIVALAVKLIGG